VYCIMMAPAIQHVGLLVFACSGRRSSSRLLRHMYAKIALASESRLSHGTWDAWDVWACTHGKCIESA
jgi:hypothetical protein